MASSSLDFRWDLSILFSSEHEWQKGMIHLQNRISELKNCEGHLGDSPQRLKNCLDLNFELQMLDGRIKTWAGLQKSADVLNPRNVERVDLTHDLSAKLSQASAFINAELAHLGRAHLDQIQKQYPTLDIYHQFIRMSLDQSDHVLDGPRAELLAALSPVLMEPIDIQQLLLNSDIPWKSITLSNGKELTVDVNVYGEYRQNANRGDREKVFGAFYDVLAQFERTLGASLGTAIKSRAIIAKTRKYPNALSEALDTEKIPVKVYETMIKQVNQGLPVFQSYLTLQKERLGLKKLEYYDVYAPGGDEEQTYPIDKTKKVMLEALVPLGPDYLQRLNVAFPQGWVDLLPRRGKDPGGFMNSVAYGVHPFLLLNYQNNFSSASTFAHEWGHAMHSVYTNATQPYAYSFYSTFIAEISSTTNEILLHEHLIQKAKTPMEKAFYLEALLKFIQKTFFRQAQFAEFELGLYKEVENGSALSGQRISEIFGETARKYYGHSTGVINVDRKYFSEWAFLPAFYRGFSVYPYATSISAAFYFTKQILTGKPNAVENYLNVLRAGSSKYPYDILMDAGIDMKAPDVYQVVVERMQSAIQDLRQISK